MFEHKKICEICGREFKNFKGLAPHIRRSHNISSRNYYIKYIGKQKYCYCGEKTEFINLNEGFQTYCSLKCVANSPEVREKTKQTCFERFGEDNPNKNEKVKEKMKQTNLDRHGVDNYSKTKEFKEKYKQTCLDKFGEENPAQSEEVRNKTRVTQLATNLLKAKTMLSEFDLEIIGKYENCRDTIEIRCKKCNSIFHGSTFNIKHRVHKCPVCDPVEISRFEQEVRDNIIKHLVNKFGEQIKIIYNDRTVLAPYELDILIPELQISIEINGDYWHSLEGVPERDHWKAETMREKGYKHFVIKESEWIKNKQFTLQKFDQILKIDLEIYSKNLSTFTGF
jgi:hypothetical protein